MKKRRGPLSSKLSTRKYAVTDPRQIPQIGRNDPCPCGSEKKYKDCHEPEGEAFLSKLVKEEARRKLREAGVPWWKRWFLT